MDRYLAVNGLVGEQSLIETYASAILLSADAWRCQRSRLPKWPWTGPLPSQPRKLKRSLRDVFFYDRQVATRDPLLDRKDARQSYADDIDDI